MKLLVLHLSILILLDFCQAAPPARRHRKRIVDKRAEENENEVNEYDDYQEDMPAEHRHYGESLIHNWILKADYCQSIIST